jgi:hypothetical protein
MVPITTTLHLEGTPVPLTILTVLSWTAIPQPDTGLLPQQQAWANAWPADTQRRATQGWGELTSEQAAIEAQLAELHHHKSALKTERVIMVNLTNAWAQARDVTAAINCEGAQYPAFTRASQNMATAVTLLDTLPTPSTDEVDKVYRQLKDILDTAIVQQVEGSF